MAKLEHIARVTVRGKGLDAATDGSDKSNAFLVHQAILTKIRELNPGAVATIYRKDADGSQAAGFEWHGAMATVVHDLWPVESTLRDPVTGNSLGVVINKYLRQTNNAVCVARHADQRPPKWWIRAEWNDAAPVASSSLQGVSATYTEKRLTPDEAGETRAPAPVTVTFKEPVAAPAPAPLPAAEPREPLAPKAATSPTAPDVAKTRRATSIRGRANFVITPDGLPDPPDYAYFCGLTDVSGTKCKRVFTAPQSASLHRRQGHEIMDRLIEAAADLITSGRPVNGGQVGEMTGHHQTAIYSYFATVNDLYLAAKKLLTRREAAAERRRLADEKKIERQVTEAVKVQERNDDHEHAAEFIQLLVGFCHALGTPINHSALSIFPIPYTPSKRGTLISSCVNENLISYRETLLPSGQKSKILVPGVAFDHRVTRRLEAFKTGTTPAAATGETTPLDAAKLDVLAVLQLAADEITSLREAAPILKRQDEELTQLARDRADALRLAESAVDETVSARDELKTARQEIDKLTNRLDFMAKALTGNFDN